MKKQLSYYVQKLEQAGINTNKFNLELNGVVLSISELQNKFQEDDENFNNFTEALFSSMIPNNYIETSSDLFRKYGCLCLNWRKQYTKNKKHETEYGFDAYVRNELSYKYQFEFIIENLKPSNDSFYKIAKEFFSKNVMIDLCRHAIKKIEKEGDYKNLNVKELYRILDNIIAYNLNDSDFYQEIKRFNSLLGHHIWVHEFKCSSWKDAFKGLMNYCAIDYLIKQNKITDMSLLELQKMLSDKNFIQAPYKFFNLLNTLTEGMDI